MSIILNQAEYSGRLYQHDLAKIMSFILLSSLCICTYRRVQPYIVDGPVPIPHSGQASLIKNDENTCYHDDSHVI